MPTFVHRTARHLTKHLGLHGSGLVLITAIWTLVGIGSLTTPATTAQPVYLHQYIPPQVDAVLWFTAALGCLGAAIDTAGPRRDGLAIAFAFIPPAIRFVSYLWGWIVWLIPGDSIGSPRGWYSAGFYACMVGLLWLVAAIRDDRYGTSDK